ncbi:MAG: ABC transporter permease, partial [Lewinella sp.]|nr:ABC transporter permease [Lewinella sp.]
SEEARNPILLSRDLAEKLGVHLRSKVVLTFQDLDGNITAGAFRIAGLFELGNNYLNEGVVYVLRKDINRLLGAEGIAHETALFLHRIDDIDGVQQEAQELFPDLKVETYREISPDVELYEGQIQASATIFMVIIMLALLFGIINTMLMAVLERYRELGMLMSIGMNKGRVFSMIVLETLMLALVALVPGLLLGWGSVAWMSSTGIDLSAFAGGMKEFGMSQVVYPELQTEIYIQLALAVGLTAIIGALYPAWKAIRLRPVEAIRKI